MCGILGVIKESRYGGVRGELRQGMEALCHRGPDGRGEYYEVLNHGDIQSEVALGHLRLAIIDLSEQGAQPMAGLAGELVITFNGEIYNYIELRKELSDSWLFQSRSDTEVLLAAYAKWGLRMMERLDGMYSFAIWDKRISSLILARDPQGIKPLYYSIADGVIRFASEPRGIIAMTNARPKANWDTIGKFLASATSDGVRETFFSDIFQLCPGEYMTVSAGARVTWQHQFWRSQGKCPYVVPIPGEIRRVLSRSVQRQLRSDVKVGFSLSGGVDSCLLLGLAAELPGYDPSQYEALTVTSPDFKHDEGALASMMAARVGVRHHRIDLLEGDPILDFREMVRISGEPFTSLSMFGQFLLMKRARREGIKVILGGQGADEVFLGYPRLGYWIVREMCLSGNICGALKWFRLFREHTGAEMEMLLRAHIEYRSVRLRLAKVALQFAGLVSTDLLLITARAGLIQDRYRSIEHCEDAEFSRSVLPRLLRYDDRNSMAFGVESRVPFLGAEVVNLMSQVPSREKLCGAWSKSLLRRAASGLVPDQILWNTPKRGFTIPQGRMAQKLRPAIADALHDSNIGKHLNASNILKALDSSKKADWHSLWRCVSLALWAKEYNVDVGG